MDPRYRAWIENDEKRLLWIHGKPGAGKSVLSAILVNERLEETGYKRRNCGGRFVAYFFCKGTDERLRTDTAILKYLLAQILHQNPSIFHQFQNEPDYQRDEEKTRWTVGMLWNVFERI